jgi:hypothetical protein
LSTSERNTLAKDATVRSVIAMFGGDITDMRIDPATTDAAPAADETGEG